MSNMNNVNNVYNQARMCVVYGYFNKFVNLLSNESFNDEEIYSFIRLAVIFDEVYILQHLFEKYKFLDKVGSGILPELINLSSLEKSPITEAYLRGKLYILC